MSPLYPQLKTGLQGLGLSISSLQEQQFLDYLNLLSKWNKVYNLTAITDPEKMLTHHLLDSLSIHPYFSGSTWLDIGSGAGLPGVPLSILNPEASIYLLDSNGKKVRFLSEVKTQLKLHKLMPIQARVEAYSPQIQFEVITARAFSSLKTLVETSQHLLAENGYWLAMKGALSKEELSEIDSNLYDIQCHPLQVPLLEETQRTLVRIQKKRFKET